MYFGIIRTLFKSNTGDGEWVKLTYIFSSVEAIVFTAVGFIFGREVNRSRAINAEKNEVKAKRERKELAKKVLDKIPQPPASTTPMEIEPKDMSILRNTAKRYLSEKD